MFDKEFYPTPITLLEQLNIDFTDTILLEPSAGSCNIVNFAKENGAQKVYTYERNEKLAEICKGNSIFLGYDFFECDKLDFADSNLIFMNPPFSNADKHILHAWHCAPDGCRIVALCNANTLDGYGSNRELKNTIANYGYYEVIENAFSNAERKTDVTIAVVYLFKPVSTNSDYFDSFYEDDAIDSVSNFEGVIKYNEIQAIVNCYKESVKLFTKMSNDLAQVNSITKRFSDSQLSFKLGAGNENLTEDMFLVEYQKKAWAYIFDKFKFHKILSSKVIEQLNKHIANKKNIPFTVKNIYKVLNDLMMVRETIMSDSLVDSIDVVIRYSDDNRWFGEGWKTNEASFLGKKFIIPNLIEYGYGGYYRISYHRNCDVINDLVKSICNIVGIDYNSLPLFYNSVSHYYTEIDGSIYNGEVTKDYNNKYYKNIDGFNEHNKENCLINVHSTSPNTWYDWAFFRFKYYKKGTIHFEFLDENVWAMTNKKYGKIKGFVIPENITVHKKKGKTKKD